MPQRHPLLMADLTEFQRRFDGYLRGAEPAPQVYAPNVPSAEDAAMGVEAETELGVPAGAAAGLPHYRTLLDEGRVRRDLEGTTMLPQFLRDPVNAGLARDDTEPLSGLEMLGREISDRNIKALSAVARGGLNIAAAAPIYFAGRAFDLAEFEGMTRQEIEDKLLPPEARLAAVESGQHLGIAALMQQAGEIEAQLLRTKPGELEDRARRLLEAAGALRRTGEGLPRFEAQERMGEALRPAMEAEGFLDQAALMMQAFADHPADAATFLGATFLESSPGMLAAAATTLLTRNPVAGIAVMAGSSGAAEYSGKVDEFLRGNKIDISTPEGIDAVFANPAIWQEAQRKGIAKGLVVALFDAASGGIAGRALLKNPIGDIFLQAFVQGLMGGGGDAAGDVAAGDPANAVNVILEAMLEVAGTPIEVGLVAGRALRKDGDRAARAAEHRAVLERVDRAVEASVLRERAPPRFKAFLDLVGYDAFLNVPADDLQTFFQEQGRTPEELGIAREAYDAALETGADVQIPVAAYATRISGTRDAAWFHEHSTFSEDGMTDAEAQAFNDRVSDIRQEEFDKAERRRQEDIAAGASDAQVHDAIFRQLREAGQSPDAANHLATVWQAYFRSQGERYGEDPLDLARQFGVRIEGPEQAQARRRKDTRDIALDTLRARKKPRPREGLSEAEVANETALDELAAELDRRGIDINALTNDEIVAAIEGQDGETLAQAGTPEDIFATEGPWRDAQVTAHDEDGAEVSVPAGVNVDLLQGRIAAARELLECVNAG